ncbi:MFS transporter [Novosphingobium sp. RD2P27]|uniref:MFS transporter n=1 Tax=Novosphingobium kalidii TaxID=3230299 RepID=A0ABV2D3F4_9SPHN
MKPDFWIGWRQVFASMVLLAVGAATIASAYSVVAVPLAKEFNPSRMVLMLAMTVMSLVSAMLSPVLGAKMDTLPIRLITATGTASLVAGYVSLSFATSFNQVLLAYGLLMAAANVLVGPMAASVLISRWFVRTRGRALGLAISGVAIGGLVFPPLIQLLLDAFDWRTAFRIMAAVIALLMFPAVAMLVDRPSDRGLLPDGDTQMPIARRDGEASSVLSSRAIVSSSSFWLLAISFGIVLAGMKGMVTNLVPIALDQGIGAQSAALLISIFAASGFIAKLGFAAFADRVGSRLIVIASLTGFGLGCATLVGAEHGYAVIAIGVALLGFFGGLVVPLQGLIVPDLFGQASMGRATGLLNLVILVALLITPPLFGMIFDVTGNYDTAFLTFGILASVCVLVLLKAQLKTATA